MRNRTILALALAAAACATDVRKSPSGPAPIGEWRTAGPASIPTVDAAPVAHTVTRRPRLLQGASSARIGHAIQVIEDRILVLDDLNGQLVALDRMSGAVRWRSEVGPRPDRFLLRDDGAAIVSVAAAGDLVLVSADGAELDRVHLGPEPRGLALSADGETLQVAMGASGVVVTMDAQDLIETGRTELPGGVDHVAFAGSALVAGGPGPDVWVFNDVYRSKDRRVSLRIDTPFDARVRPGRSFRTFANRAGGIAINPETQRILVVHQQALPRNDFFNAMNAIPFGMPGGDGGSFETPSRQVPEGTDDSPSDQYGGNADLSVDPRLVRPVETAITAIDGERTPDTLPVRDPVTKLHLTATLAQPSDILHSPIHTLALVTGFSSDTVLALETSDSDPMTSPIAVIDVGQAPRGVAFSPDGRIAYTLDAHSLSVSAIDLGPILDAPLISGLSGPDGSLGYDSPCAGRGKGPGGRECVGDWIEPMRLNRTQFVVFGSDPLSGAARAGRRAFTYVGTPGVTRNLELACALCHPGGGQDGLIWDVPEGPRQTPSLAGRLRDTAPFNWNGDQPTLEGNMVRTVERMGGQGLSTATRAQMAAFLETLPAPESPSRGDDSLRDAQERGRLVFTDPLVGCAGCHVGDATSDGKSHDVGTGSGPADAKFNTPSLRGLLYTAPYFHNGAAATLEDVLWMTENAMGNSSQLTHAERTDLIAYLLTL